jgi:hypothetical protein
VRLEGSLDAFSLPDIFQLLSFTKKTGGLHLRRSVNGGLLSGVVFVNGGMLTGGGSDVRRQGLGRRLVGTGRVDDAAVAAAVAVAQENPGIGVGRALRDADVLDEGSLSAYATEHIYDTVFDLLRWSEGEFVFNVDEADPDDVGVSVSVEDAVAEAQGRLERWAQASTTIPGPDAVLSFELSPAEQPALSLEEWELLAFLDGTRPVRDIVDATGRGEFAVVCALAALVDRGLVVVARPDRPSAVPALLVRLSMLATAEEGATDPVVDLIPQQTAADDVVPAVDDEAEPAVDEMVEPTADTVVDDSGAAEPQIVEETFEGAEGDLAPVGAADEPYVDSTQPAYAFAEAAAEASLDTIGRTESIADRRHVEAPEATAGRGGFVTEVVGTSAVAAHAETESVLAPQALIERDPSVNKSLLLRLIAGVRGL